MINQRILSNLTRTAMMITIYIQAGSDLKSIYGTVNINVPANESRDVVYGDLRNGYILGLQIKTAQSDYADSYNALVKQRGDKIDYWLNNADTIDIDEDRLAQMEKSSSFESLLQEPETA